MIYRLYLLSIAFLSLAASASYGLRSQQAALDQQLRNDARMLKDMYNYAGIKRALEDGARPSVLTHHWWQKSYDYAHDYPHQRGAVQAIQQLLLQYGANPRQGYIASTVPLIEAARNNNVMRAYTLLRGGVLPDCSDAEKYTPLHWACQNNCIALARLLLHYRAPVDVTSDCGDTPLLLAIETGNEELVHLLIQHGACVHGPDNAAMISAVEEDNPKITALLARYGADVNVQDDRELTPLMYAIQYNSQHMRILLQYGARIACNETLIPEKYALNAALAYALKHCNGAAAILIEHGAWTQCITISEQETPRLYHALQQRVHALHMLYDHFDTPTVLRHLITLFAGQPL